MALEKLGFEFGRLKELVAPEVVVVGSPEPVGEVVLVLVPAAVVLAVGSSVLFEMTEHNISSR